MGERPKGKVAIVMSSWRSAHKARLMPTSSLFAGPAAGPALFLASDDASFISGEVLMVDGGITTIYNGHGNPFVPGKGPTI